MAERRLAAVDLGAQSGRVAIGFFDGERVALEVVHRFANQPLWLPDGLHWNLPQLFADTMSGLAQAASDGPLDGVGVDSWGCDYALLDEQDRMLGLPFHYRDPARASAAVMDEAFARVPRHELYARTGIQTMPINTVFQLVSEADSPALAAAQRIALMPDLFGLWLTGTLVNERTGASTTGLLEARGNSWTRDLLGRLGLPQRPFATDAVSPGTELGRVLDGHRGAAGAAVGTVVRTVAGHDTASAFAAAPRGSVGAAVLSSGTWSLLGIHTAEPRLGADAEAFNLTNERGVADSIRLLRNVMGMWLIEECRREWDDDAGYEALWAQAATGGSEVPLFDPDDESLLHPGPMVDRISALSTTPDAAPDRERSTLIRSVLTSLACKYRLVVERLESVSGQRIEVVQVLGGAVRNALMCQLTADVVGRPVLAGPTEATLLGNVLVQLLAGGELANMAELRELSARSAQPVCYECTDAAAGEATYQRFLETTGLESPHVRAAA